MAEFICRLGTPAGEVVREPLKRPASTKRAPISEREGFKVFNVTAKNLGRNGVDPFWARRSGSRQANDFLLFNQQLAALIRAGIPILQEFQCWEAGGLTRLRAVLGDVEEEIRVARPCRGIRGAGANLFPESIRRLFWPATLRRLDEGVEPLRHLMRPSVGLRPQDSGRAGLSGFLLFASLCMITF